MYRTKDWKNTYENTVVIKIDDTVFHWSPYIIYEAGADAMFDGLRREGNSRGGRVVDDPIRGTGTWLFIPDEE